MLTATTKASGALFTVKPEDRKENGPTMTGLIELDKDNKINIGGFLKAGAESGRNYLSLKLGRREDAPLYGKLFATESKQHDSSPDYSGFIDLDADGEQQLRLFGRKQRSSAGQAYIAIDVVPVKTAVADGELPL